MSSETPKGLVDRLSAFTGKAAAWLTLFMVIVTFVVVVLRYVFDAGLIWLQESVIWMHAVVFMLGAAYTLQQEDHVRVDVFYRTMSARGRALVDLIGVILFSLLALVGLVDNIHTHIRLWQMRNEITQGASMSPVHQPQNR